MSRDDHAHLYRAVPVLVWPWLWWQLFRLRLWVAATGRDVLCGVDRWGNLHVHLVGDDPARWAPSAHPHLHQYYLTEDLPDETRPQWRVRIAAVFCAGFGVQDWVIFPRRSGEACGAEGDDVRAKIRDPVVLCDALTPCGRRITKQVPRQRYALRMNQAQG